MDAHGKDRAALRRETYAFNRDLINLCADL